MKREEVEEEENKKEKEKEEEEEEEEDDKITVSLHQCSRVVFVGQGNCFFPVNKEEENK